MKASVGFYLENNLPHYNKESGSTPEELINNNLRLVRHIINKRFHDVNDFCQSYRVTYDEIFSSGVYGLIKAANNFDPGKGIKFATFASRCIFNELGMFIRKHKRSFTLVSIDHTINTDENGNSFHLMDILEDFDNDIESIIETEYNRKLLDKLFTSLKPRDKEIIRLFFEDEMTQAEVGEHLGLSQSYMSRKIKMILGKAKKLHNVLQVS